MAQNYTTIPEKTSSPMATTIEPIKSSLKIQTTITETKSVDKEIDLPYFCQYGDNYIKVIDENYTISVDKSETWTRILKTRTSNFKDELVNGIEITAEEFEAALQTAYAHLPKSIL